MISIGKEIGIPGELVSDSKNWRGKIVKYTVDNYDSSQEEYELSNGVSVVFLSKDIVEKSYRVKGDK